MYLLWLRETLEYFMQHVPELLSVVYVYCLYVNLTVQIRVCELQNTRRGVTALAKNNPHFVIFLPPFKVFEKQN